MMSGQDPIARIARHLDTSAAPGDQAAAAATLAIIISQQQQAPLNLNGICTKLVNLLDGSEEGVKPNVLAALSAATEASDAFAKEAIEAGIASKVVWLLTATPSAELPSARPARQTALNALTALGTAGEASEAGMQAVVDAGGVPAIIPFLSSSDPIICEAAADAACKLMSSGQAAKTAAAEAGMVPALAALLSCEMKKAEVTVRALLGLGMLIEGSEELTAQLAAAPGAVVALLALMRQQDDGDSQHIAAGIFSAMGKSPAAKESVVAALRQTTSA